MLYALSDHLRNTAFKFLPNKTTNDTNNLVNLVYSYSERTPGGYSGGNSNLKKLYSVLSGIIVIRHKYFNINDQINEIIYHLFRRPMILMYF